jgi:excisionase family DNA binding protein
MEYRDMKEEKERRTYSIEEAARILGIGRNSAYEAARSGQLPTIEMGKRKLVPKVVLDRMVNGEAA